MQIIFLFLLLFTNSMVWGANKTAIEKITSDEVARKVAKEEKKKERVENKSKMGVPQELKIHSLGIGLGQTFLRGDFKDNGRDSITADVYYNYSVSYSFDLLLNTHFSEHRVEDKKTTLQAVAMGIKAKLYHFDSFSPFVMGGFGLYRPRTLETPGQLIFGTHLGGGVELDLNRKWSFGMLGHYHNPFDAKDKKDSTKELQGYYYKILLTTFYRF